MVVPEIWPFEIANGIFVAFAKRMRIDEADIHEYLELLESLPVRVVRAQNGLNNSGRNSLWPPPTRLSGKPLWWKA